MHRPDEPFYSTESTCQAGTTKSPSRSIKLLATLPPYLTALHSNLIYEQSYSYNSLRALFLLVTTVQFNFYSTGDKTPSICSSNRQLAQRQASCITARRCRISQ